MRCIVKHCTTPSRGWLLKNRVVRQRAIAEREDIQFPAASFEFASNTVVEEHTYIFEPFSGSSRVKSLVIDRVDWMSRVPLLAPL